MAGGNIVTIHTFGRSKRTLAQVGFVVERVGPALSSDPSSCPLNAGPAPTIPVPQREGQKRGSPRGICGPTAPRWGL
jgi:hypothetical protein